MALLFIHAFPDVLTVIVFWKTYPPSEELSYVSLIPEYHFAEGDPDTLQKNYCHAEVELYMVTAAFLPCTHFSSLHFPLHSVSQP